jgi:hypothetical protein
VRRPNLVDDQAGTGAKAQGSPPAKGAAARTGLRVFTAFFFGILAANILWLPYVGVLIVVTIPTSFLVGVLLLPIVLVVALIGHRHIAMHLRGWCIAAPAGITAAYIALDRTVLFSQNSGGLWSRGGLALTCAIACSAVFYAISAGRLSD